MYPIRTNVKKIIKKCKKMVKHKKMGKKKVKIKKMTI
jgi:hypothetical protein